MSEIVFFTIAGFKTIQIIIMFTSLQTIFKASIELNKQTRKLLNLTISNGSRELNHGQF